MMLSGEEYARPIRGSHVDNCLDRWLRERKALERQRHKEIVNAAEMVIDECNGFIRNCDDVDDVKFVKKLGDYIALKIWKTNLESTGYRDLQNRSEFAASVLKLVISKNTPAQVNILADINIRKFKGYVTQRFYDILTERRETITIIERMKIIHETMRLPRDLSNLVISYEKKTTLLHRMR